MKIYFRCVAIFLVLQTLTSCSKKDVGLFDGLSPLTKEVISQKSFYSLKHGHAMLSVEEREALWRCKLSFILSNKNERFTVEQRNIVLEVNSFLLRYGMAELLRKPQLGRQFLDSRLPYFTKHFSKEQLNVLLESPLLVQNLVISDISPTVMNGLIQSSLGANSPQNTPPNARPEGGFCTCIYDLGCPGPSNYCINSGCRSNPAYEMCGVFGTSNCTSRCSGGEPTMTVDPLGGNPL